MKYIQVTNEIYTSPNSLVNIGGKWVPAKPELLYPNLYERFLYFIGKHISFGQPFCVICGKKEV